MPNILPRVYTDTKGAKYDYEASYERGAGKLVIWSAKVRVAGAIRGEPGGTFDLPLDLDPVPSVIAHVEDSIKNGVGVLK